MPLQFSNSDVYPYSLLRLAIITLLTLGILIATPSARSSGSVQVQYLQDSSDTEDIFIDINTDLSEKATLFTGVGKTRSPASAADLDLDYWNFGFGLQLGKAFDIELEIGNFGQDRDINTDTIDVRLRWSLDDWAFSIKPQYDEIDVLLTGLNRIREFDSTGIGVTLAYYGIKNWEYSLSYDTYDYSLDLRRLPVIARIVDISAKALTIASGLKDNVASADITYLAANTDITLAYARSKSAIDQTSSNVVSLAFDFYHFMPYRLGLEMGSVGSDIDTANHYAGISAGYSW